MVEGREAAPNAGRAADAAARRSRLLSEVGALFESFSYDRAEVVERFVRIARGIAPFDAFALVLAREEGGVEVVASSDIALPPGADPAALRLEDFQPDVRDGSLRFVVDEIEEEGPNPLLRPGGRFRSCVTIPLVAASHAVGVLLLASVRPRAFDAEDMDLYFTIGSQLAVALENIRFHREARDQIEVAAALHASEVALARITNVREIEDRLVRSVEKILALPAAALYEVDAEHEGRVIPRAAHVAGERRAGGAAPVEIPQAEARALLVEGNTLSWTEGGGPPPAIRLAGTRSVLLVPLTEAGRTVYVLAVGSPHARAFPRARRILVELFAAHAASVLANARLYARLEAKAAELERSNLLVQQYAETLKDTNVALERRLYELSTMYDVVQETVRAGDLETALRFVLEKACGAMSCEKGSILLFEGDLLRAKVTRGIEGVESLEFARGEGIAGWVAATGQPRIVEDTTREARFVRRGATPARPETMLCVPLRAGEQVIGVLNVDRDLRFGPFTQEELRFLSALASAAEGTIQRLLLVDDLHSIVDEVLEAFATAVEARDKYTYGHSKRVRAISLAIARRLRLSDDEVATIGRAALLHDIGKIGIPNEILLKEGPLTPVEMDLMREHPVMGERIVRRVRRMAEVARIVRHHHEWWDGTGYPDGLAGDRIPLGSAIICVADAYDTIVTERPYRPARGRQEALEELRRCGGKQFHPLVVGAFLSLAERSAPTSASTERSAAHLRPVEGAGRDEDDGTAPGGLAAAS